MKVVGIGASAGGMEALVEMLAQVPTDTGATWVIVSHLSPNHKSILDELLARHTKMPIQFVETTVFIQPNHLYLNPPGKSLVMEKGMLIPRKLDRNRALNLPIDDFFHSLGTSLKENALGVILSGTGTDGARGVRTIKEEGGLVFVQTLESAKFDGMPRAIVNQNIADQVLTPGDLGKFITEVLKAKQVPRQVNLKEQEMTFAFSQIIAYVSKVSGIDYAVYREPTLIRRLENRMLLRKIKDLSKYLHLLKNDEVETRALNNDFLIGVTRFFRDPEAYALLEKEILPQIFANSEKGRTVRLWVSGCSTGEEAYSLSMLVDQYIRKHQLQMDFKLFASDIDDKAIRVATEGRYPYSIAAEVPPNLLLEYFQKEADTYQVKSSLKDKILFAIHDLLSDPPFIQMDLITCRNLLIYLKPEAQHVILSAFYFALNPNSFLFLGPSESLGEVKDAFVPSTKKWNIFSKKEDVQLPFRKSYAKLPHPIKSPVQNSKPMDAASPNRPQYEENLQDPFTRYLVDHFAPISIFLTTDMDILYINGDIDNLLRLPRAIAKLNLSKMVDKEQLSVFKSGILKATSGPGAYHFKDVVFNKNDQQVLTNLTFRKINLPGYTDDLFLVQIKEGHSTENEIIAEKFDATSLVKDQVLSLQKQLEVAQRRTRQLVSELETANEELVTANQELLAANEELQSTNEELQSVNEELYTVNSELQAKNETLITTINDINNLLRGTEIGTIFLDSKLNIRKFTPAIRKQFDLLNSDIGRPIHAFSSSFETLDIKGISTDVFETLESFESEVVDKKGNHYLLRILPYRTGESIIEGIVITFIDINELVRIRADIAIQANKFNAIFTNSKDILMVLNYDGKIRMINKNLGQTTIAQMEHRQIQEFFPKDASASFFRTFEEMFKTKTTQILTLHLNFDEQDPKWYEISFIPTADSLLDQETINKATVIMHDVTSQMISRKSLEETLLEFRAFMDHAQHQIALVDEKGKMYYVNYTQRTGISREEMVGTHIYDYLPKDQHQKVRDAITEVFAGLPFGRIEFIFIYPDGRKIEAELIATPVTVEGVIKYVALIGQPRNAKNEGN